MREGERRVDREEEEREWGRHEQGGVNNIDLERDSYSAAKQSGVGSRI